MKKSLLVVALLSAFAPVLAQAEAGDIVVRLRAAYVNPDEHSKLGSVSAAAGLASAIGADAKLAVGNNTIPELDISYYVTKNIALELILALGTRHDVYLTKNALPNVAGSLGNENLGSVNLLPPTLTAQWHFNPDQMIDPYVGAGINYTHTFDHNLKDTAAGLPIHIEDSMFGAVAQAGVDVNLGSGWLINADVKYVTMNTNVTVLSGGTWKKIDDLDINPWIFGVGIGKKF